MKLKLLFTFLLLILLQTNGFGAIITVATNKNWSAVGSTSTERIIVKKDDVLANDTANANCPSPSILPASACPAYTASISTTSSVCNTAPPGSVSLNVTIVGGQSPYSVQFRNEITSGNTTVNNYTSGSSINISVPTVTTPYTLVSVTDANGCLATITVAYTSILLYSIPATPTATIVDAACSSDATGSITMNNAYQPGSLKFNGVNTGSGTTTPVDSHVDFGTTLLSNRAQFTGEGWIKFDKTKYQNRMALFGQNDVVEFGFEGNNLRCWTAGGGTVDYPLTSYPGDNAWHHIAVVANGTNLQFYIDGVSVKTGGSATSNYGPSTAYTTKIGWGVMDAGGVGLVGEVFNLSFWSRALSPNEIVGLATGFTQYNSKQVGLLAGYSFNEGAGTSMSSVGSVAPIGILKGATLPVWTDPSTYSWTSIPAGFTSNLKNLTGLSPKTYNLAINLKGCPKTTSFVVKATNATPTITTAATPAVVSTVCTSTSPQTTTMVYTSTTGLPTSYSIVWTGIANQSSTPFAFAPGGGNVTGIKVPANTPAGTYAGTMTIKTDNGCTSNQSISLIVGSVTPATPTVTAATNVGCSGFTANWSPVAGATGYYLDVSPDSNFGNFNLGGFQDKDVTLATSFVVTGLTTPGQTYYYRIRAYNKCGSTLIGGYSNKVSISVSVAVTNSILTQTICSGDSSVGVVLTSGVAGTTFDWMASAPSGVTGFTASGTGTSSIPVQTITNSGTAPGTVTYSITPKANGCTGTAVNYTIIVNPTPKISNTQLTQTICSGGSSSLVTFTSGTTGATFVWTATATSGVSGFSTSGTDVIPALNISTSGTTQGTITYVVTPTANGCPGTASNYTILVNPTPIVTNTPLTETICSGGSSTLVTLTSGVTGTTFAWTASATAGVSGFSTSGASTIPVQAISTTGTTQGTVTYVITPMANSCPGTATNYTVLVNPKPAVTNMTAASCSASAFTVSPANATNGIVPSGTTYSWSAPSVTGITGTASGTNQANIGGTLTNTTSAPINVAYTVTPAFGTCTGSSFTVTVTINPLPNNISNGFSATTICAGGSPELIFDADNGATFTPSYSITYKNNDSPTIYTQSITTASPFSFTPGDYPTANAQYTLISISNGTCTRTTLIEDDGANLIVRPKPTIVISGTTSVCMGDTPLPGISFQNTHTVSKTVTYSINGNLPHQTIVVPANSTRSVTVSTAASGSFVYKLESIVYGDSPYCINNDGTGSATVTVRENSGIISINGEARPTGNVTYCPSNLAIFSIPAVSGATSYTWIVPAGWKTETGVAITAPITGSSNELKVITGSTLAESGNVTVTANTFCPSNLWVALSGTALTAPTATPTALTCAVPTGTIKVTSPVPASGTKYTLTSTNPLVAPVTNTDGNFSGLNAGDYIITYQLGSGCVSPGTAVISIQPLATKTWNGTTWSPAGGPPSLNDYVVFNGDYNLSHSIDACSCTVNATKHVTIAPGKILIIENALNVQTGGSLTFENGASLIQNNKNAINTGDIIYRRTASGVKDFDYVYWSSPVAGQKLGILSPQSDKYWSWFGDYWTPETGGVTMTEGKGYIARVPRYVTSQSVAFIGPPHNGDISIATQGINKSNVIGNPYPSAIDVTEFMTDNIDLLLDSGALLHFWTHVTPRAVNGGGTQLGYVPGDYSSINVLGGTIVESGRPTPNGTIAAGQSFMVSSKKDGFFKFTNSMRIDEAGKNSQFFKQTNTKKTAKTEKNRIWLNLTNSGGAFKQLLVGYATGATNDVDKLFDGVSLNGNAYVDFYSVVNSKKYTIQGRKLPFDETDEVPLGYNTTIEGTFQISIDKTDGFLRNQVVYLKDKTANVIHDLTKGSYSFTTAKGDFKDRFVLRYTNTSKLGTGDFDPKGKGVIVSVNNSQIKINSFDSRIVSVKVYDLKGSLLYEKDKADSNEFVINHLNSSNQFMIVMVQLEDGKWISEEIIFHD